MDWVWYSKHRPTIRITFQKESTYTKVSMPENFAFENAYGESSPSLRRLIREEIGNALIQNLLEK